MSEVRDDLDPSLNEPPPRPSCYRVVDIAQMLAEGPVTVAWRCEGVVEDGTLTILAGKHGEGKTWFAHQLAAGVARGETVAGIRCERGKAVVIDAEMGARMTVGRWSVAGMTNAGVHLIDAMGFSLANDEWREYLKWDLKQRKANFVVLDSLRKMSPGKRENDSDDMSPLITEVAMLARETGAAVLLIHHLGKDGSPRGSSAIADQTDALFKLVRKQGNTDGRRLTCRAEDCKPPRNAMPPEDRYLALSPEDGGFVPGDAPTSDEQLKADILEAAPAPNRSQLAKKIGKHSGESRFVRLCDKLEAEGHLLIVSPVAGDNTAGEAVRFTSEDW